MERQPEQIHNPESDGPIQGLYKKVKTYLPEVENELIDKVDNKISHLTENCDKVVAKATHVADLKTLKGYANGLTQRVLNEIEDRLNGYLRKFENQTTTETSTVAARVPENRVARLYRKSKKLNRLVLKKITEEVSRLAGVVVSLDYPQIIVNLSNNMIMEAKIVKNVAYNIIGDWLSDQLRSWQVNFRRVKNGFAFDIKKCTDPKELKNQIMSRLTSLKDVSVKIVDKCVSIELTQDALLQNLEAIRNMVTNGVQGGVQYMIEKPKQILNGVQSGVQYVREKPVELFNEARTESRKLYEKVMREYTYQSIAARRNAVKTEVQPAH